MKETAYLLQAALICAWWAGLASSQSFFDAFQYSEVSPKAFWSFLVPDVLLLAVLSAVRAYRKSDILQYVILGAFAYASLYCVNASLLTGTGFLPTTLMILGLAYNVFLCFDRSLFRNATSSFFLNVIKTLVQIVCIWTIALIAIPYVILEAFGEFSMALSLVQRIIAACLFAASSALGLTSAFVMVRDGGGTPLPLDQTNELVVSGPYQYIRNPMAVAGIGQGLSIAIAYHSVAILAYSLLGAVLWHVVVRPVEENDMSQRFGEPYLEYQQQVACWIPRLRRLE